MKKRLQVFISSTFTDLLEERQAAVSTVLKAGHIPAGMELFAAGDESQMQTIQRWIDGSDVYMLILGGRYGSIEPSSGLSYTELEYDYAVEKGIPLFAVVIEEGFLEERVKALGTGVIEMQHQAELKSFRNKVLSRTSSFFGSTGDIRLAVYETLTDFLDRYEFAGWVPATGMADAQALTTRLSELADENARLQKELAQTRAQLSQVASGDEAHPSFEELMQILQETPLTVPDGFRDDIGPVETDALELLNLVGESVIMGVNNSYNTSKGESFLFHQLMPRLQLYGLAASEAVPDVQWRRYALTPFGVDFLAYVRDKNGKPATFSRLKDATKPQD